MKKSVGKIVGKKKKKLYDDEFKKFVVQEYMNSGNASGVARKHDIARCTLLEWVKYYSNITTSSAAVSQACIQAIEKTSDAAVRSIEQATATRQEFLQQHYAGVSTLFSTLITKMTNELSDDNKHPSLRDQAAALTALVNFIKEFTPTEEQGTTTINLLQQTVNKQLHPSLQPFWPFPSLFCQTILLYPQILPTLTIKQLAKIFPKAKRKHIVNNFLNHTQTKNPDL